MGNERADLADKSTASALLIMDNTVEKFDLQKYIRTQIRGEIAENNQKSCHAHYSRVKPNLFPHLYQIIVEKSKVKTFAKIRLGHTAAYECILKKSNPLKNAIMDKILRLNIYFLNAKNFSVFEDSFSKHPTL